MSVENFGDVFGDAEEVVVSTPPPAYTRQTGQARTRRSLAARWRERYCARAAHYQVLKQHSKQTELVWIKWGYGLRAAAEVGGHRRLKRGGAYLLLRTVMEWNLFWTGVRFLDVATLQTPKRMASAFHADPWVWLRDKLISISVLVIISLEALAIVSLSGSDLLPKAEAASPYTDATQPIPPAAQTTSTPVTKAQVFFPADNIARTWKRGSFAMLAIGYDQRRMILGDLKLGAEVCGSAALVVLGGSSLEGSAAGNRKLAHSRAETLGVKAREASALCSAPPAVVLVALWEPIATEPDGGQRRALVVGLDAERAALLDTQWAENLSAMIDPALATLPSAYTKRQVCEVNAGGGCAWRAALSGRPLGAHLYPSR